MKDALESGLQCVTEMPYFEGDFWPNVHEESITELEQEEEDQRKRKEVEAAISDDAADEPATVGEEFNEVQRPIHWIIVFLGCFRLMVYKSRSPSKFVRYFSF